MANEKHFAKAIIITWLQNYEVWLSLSIDACLSMSFELKIGILPLLTKQLL